VVVGVVVGAELAEFVDEVIQPVGVRACDDDHAALVEGGLRERGPGALVAGGAVPVDASDAGQAPLDRFDLGDATAAGFLLDPHPDAAVVDDEVTAGGFLDLGVAFGGPLAEPDDVEDVGVTGGGVPADERADGPVGVGVRFGGH